MKVLKEFRDEAIFAGGVLLSFILVALVETFEYYSLWGSLICIVLTASYFSFTFYRSKHASTKFVYFILLIALIILYFAMVYKAFGIIESSSGELIKPNWLDSIYFSVVTWTTLGYGDFHPINELKIWVIVEAIMGYVFMGLIVGKALFLLQLKKREEDT